jgi:hypothetical protein
MQLSTFLIALFYIFTYDLFQWQSASFVESKPAPITDPSLVEGKVIKGTRNGLYLVKNGESDSIYVFILVVITITSLCLYLSYLILSYRTVI